MPLEMDNYSKLNVITRNVNGIDVNWIVKTTTESTWDLITGVDIVYRIYIKEVGTNYSAENLESWIYGIYTPLFGLDENNPLAHGEIKNQVGRTLTSPINSNDFTLVASYAFNVDYELYEMYSNHPQITLDCPANSVFDGYGKYDTKWLAYDVCFNNAPDLSKIQTSELSVANANIGSDTTMLITNNSSAPLFHIVQYTYEAPKTGAITDDREWLTIGNPHRMDRDFQWIIPMDFYATIPNDRKGTIYYKLTTFSLHKNGNYALIDVFYTTCTVYAVEEDCKPSCSPVIVDTNQETIALTGNSSNLVRYKSYAKYTTNEEAKHYATIKSIQVTNGSTSYNTSTGTFQGFTNDFFTFQIEDSRGYSTTVTYTPTVIPYILLTCLIEAEQPTADGVLNFAIIGSYWNNNFGVKDNTLKVYYRVKEINQATNTGVFSEWTELVYEIVDGRYTAMVSIENIDYRNTFIIEAYAVDVFGRIDAEQEATSAIPIFDWSINDFNMNVDMAVYGSLTVNGDVTVTGSINGAQGTGGSGSNIHYGTCLTSANTEAKLVRCPTFTTLEAGASIRVKFDNANTSSTVILNVNNTGTVTALRASEPPEPGVYYRESMKNAWTAGEVKDFVFDGKYWVMVDGLNATRNELNSLPTIKYGTWTPNSLIKEAYTIQNGWYTRIGNVVTVGFEVQFTYQTDKTSKIILSGLPFKASNRASGGGLIYNSMTGNTLATTWQTTANDTILSALVNYDNSTTTYVLRCSGTVCYMISD